MVSTVSLREDILGGRSLDLIENPGGGSRPEGRRAG
jgi:hypothetical protein